jgi:diketogulonate reductase-like aldo/keto reductase
VDEGLTKAIGLSNASLPQVEEILAAAKHKPVVNQVGGFVCQLKRDYKPTASRHISCCCVQAWGSYGPSSRFPPAASLGVLLTR